MSENKDPLKLARELEVKLGEQMERELGESKIEKDKKDEHKESVKEKEEFVEKSQEPVQSEAAEKEMPTELLLAAVRQGYADALLAKEKAEKTVEKLRGWRNYFFQTGKKLQAKDRAEEEFENAQKNLGDVQTRFKVALKNYRGDLIGKKTKELTETEKDQARIGKELEKYAKEVTTLTSAKEATEIYTLKHQIEIEEKARLSEGQKWEWIKSKGLEMAQWYRKLDWKYKVLAAAGFGLAGVGVGAAGGATGAALITGLAFGRATQRVLGGAATALGLESWMKGSQEKAAEKKITKEFGENFLKALQEKNDALDNKLFDILGGKKTEERRRYILAGSMGVLIGTGALAQAFNNLIPASWKASIIDKFGHKPSVGQHPGGHSEVPKFPGTAERPGGIVPLEAPKTSEIWELKVEKGESPLLLAKHMYLEHAEDLGYTPEMGDIENWAQVASARHIVGQYIGEHAESYKDLIAKIGQSPKDPAQLGQWLHKIPKGTFDDILQNKVPNLVYEGDMVRVGGGGDITAFSTEGNVRLGHIDAAKLKTEIAFSRAPIETSAEVSQQPGEITGGEIVPDKFDTHAPKVLPGKGAAFFEDKPYAVNLPKSDFLPHLAISEWKIIQRLGVEPEYLEEVKNMNLKKFLEKGSVATVDSIKRTPIIAGIREYLEKNSMDQIGESDLNKPLGMFLKKILKIE